MSANPANDAEVLGLAEIADLLEVTKRTPHAWKYRKLLPPHDHDSVNGLTAWNRSTIIEWAAATGRLPVTLRSDVDSEVAPHRGGRAAKETNLKALADAGIIEASAS